MADSIGAFVPLATSALFHYHLNECGVTDLVVYNDCDAFTASTHGQKVALFQMPFPFGADSAFTDTFNHCVAICDSVVVLCSELHGRTVEFIGQNDKSNIVYFVCGALNFDMQYSKVYSWHDWFITTKHFYKYVKPDFLDQLQPYAVKERMFDVLLGTQKPHRNVAHDYILNNNLEDQVVMTYFKSPTLTHKFDDQDTDEWIWPADFTDVKDRDTDWTVKIVDYQGHRMSLSQIIPTQVYNRTAYTIVAETNTDNDWAFFTEKIVKPILARRMFVVLGNRYYLRALRALGFRTFSDIIDESYDNAELDRAQMAMEQVAWLCQQPQDQILARIKPICDHNYNLMMNTDWYDVYFKPHFARILQMRD